MLFILYDKKIKQLKDNFIWYSISRDMETNGDEKLQGAVSNTIIAPNTRGQYMYWLFTLNNYVIGDVERLRQLFNVGCTWYRFQKEVGENGTPHLQGVCHFRGKMRLSQVRTHYSLRAHWEPSKSEAANEYCAKEETFAGERWEGGKRREPKQLKDKYPDIKEPILTKKITLEDLNEEQKLVLEYFLGKCPLSDRVIHWLWERKGNWGKTLVALYLIDNYGALLLAGGSKDAINGLFSYIKENDKVPPIIIFDIPRCSKGHISYNALEQIKNGCVFNAKYETGMLRFDKPHVIVFANEEPEYSKLSRDRWQVKNLREKEEFEEFEKELEEDLPEKTI